MNARMIWGVTEGDFPVNASPRKKIEFALTYVALTPTESNWQPWYFRVADTHVELMAKNSPEREAADPERRGFMIGCGSALVYLKLALKHFGCLGRVEIFPDLGKPALVAKIHYGNGREKDEQEKKIFEAMLESRTRISPLGERPVTEAVLAMLSHAAAGERGWLDFVQSETGRQHILEATLATDLRWTNPETPVRPRNLAAEARVARWMKPIFAFGDHDVDLGNESLELDDRPAIPLSTLAVVKTKTDDKHGWLEAGQTMARTVLLAQALGLSWDFFDPVRRREAREGLRTGVGHKGFAQVILQFGPLMADDMVAMAAKQIRAELFR